MVMLIATACELNANPRAPATAAQYNGQGYAPQGYAAPAPYPPPPPRWTPAPDVIYEARRPPPPQIPAQAPVAIGGPAFANVTSVRSGFVPLGSCLPGFAKNTNGVCVFNVASLITPFQPPNVPARPTDATVMVESALVNAKKFDDRCWDPGCDEEQTRAAFQKCAAIAGMLDPPDKLYYDAFAVLAPMAMGVWSNPDTYGHAYVFSNGAYSAPVTLTVQRNKDNLTPQWGVQFSHVVLSPNSALRLEFWDADPDIPFTNGDDPMGIVTISGEELMQAAQGRRTHRVNVAKQTNNQVLFVNISVLPES